jgi:hypothetical protein
MEDYDFDEIEEPYKTPHIADIIEAMNISTFDRWVRTDQYGLIKAYYTRSTILSLYQIVEPLEELGKYQDYLILLLKNYFQNRYKTANKRANCVAF